MTAGQTYDIYLRVNNDGCNPVTDLAALIYIANPDLGLSTWQSVEPTYTLDPNHTTVMPFSRAILGPFPWAPPAGSTGHKCLLAAIQAQNEVGPAQPLPLAYTSNQVAQRNLQFAENGCQYSISNTSPVTTFLQLGLGITSPGPGAEPTVTLKFSDGSASSPLATWASTWQAQGAPLTVSTTKNGSGAVTELTVTTAGTPQIALNPVALQPNDSPSIAIEITPALSTTPTVALSATLRDIHGNIESQNGGSCEVSVPPEVK